MRYYILILLAVILLALQFSTNKLYQLKCGNTAVSSLTFSAMSGLTTSAIFLILTLVLGENFSVTPYSLCMAAIIAVLCCSYTFIGFKIMSLGSMSVFMMFLMLGGMLLPYLFGVFYLGEPLTVSRIIGVILLAVSMIFPVMSKKQSGGIIFFILCATVFVLNGGVSVTSKLHQMNTVYSSCGATVFVFLTNLMTGIISVIGLAVLGRFGKKEEVARLSSDIRTNARIVIFIVIGNAVCGGVSYLLQLIGAANVPASVLYPLVTGGSVVLSTVAGRLFFGEKPDKIQAVGIALSFVSTFLFLF